MLEVDLLSSTVESVDVGFHRFANTGANSIIYKELAKLTGGRTGASGFQS